MVPGMTVLRSTLLLLVLLGLPVRLGAQDPAASPVDQGSPAAIASPALSADDVGLRAFVAGLRPRALREGVAPATFDRETAGLFYNARVVRLDRAQPGGTPGVAPAGYADFAPYRRQHVDAAHINKGQALAQQLAVPLAGLQARSGVDSRVALSIFGHETGYGSFTGNFDLLRSFATLAYDGRRRELFTVEFIATLKLIDRGFSRAELTGSWAGATGFPQFLPSVYLRIGTDGDGDGKADIWTDRADALASIAAYLKEAGWKPGVPWGVPVSVPEGFDRTAVATRLSAPRCPRVHARLSRWLTMAEWRARGLEVQGTPVPGDHELAQLIEPDGPGMTAYLLTTNYQPILDYNCSNYYALAVGLLADEIAR
jgi:lytic murein transglycosylase